MENFGTRLKHTMEEKGMSASELSRASGVGKNLISYYIHGRCLAKQDKVFLLANKTFRRDKVARRLNINEGSADLLIDKVDEARENFTKTFSGKTRYDARNYDLAINVAGMEPKEVARFIAACVRNKMK